MDKFSELITSSICSKLIKEINTIEDPTIKYFLFCNFTKNILNAMKSAVEYINENINQKKIQLENYKDMKKKSKHVKQEIEQLEKLRNQINDISETLNTYLSV